MARGSNFKSWIAPMLKFGISGAILAYLIRDAWGNQAFHQLVEQPKDWSRLGAAFVVCLLAVLVTIVRWHVLVRALEIPFTMRDALRLGFLGFLLNFVSLGSVGGDLFKAVFLAREQPERRPESVASVVVDRAVGLYALFLLASGVILLWGRDSLTTPETLMIGRGAGPGTGLALAVVPRHVLPSLSAACRFGWPADAGSRSPKDASLVRHLLDSGRWRCDPGIETLEPQGDRAIVHRPANCPPGRVLASASSDALTPSHRVL